MSLDKRFIPLLFLCFVLHAPSAFAAPARSMDELAVVEGDRFILNLKYNSEDNFLHQNVYAEFGINACLLQPDVQARLQQLVPILREKKLKLVLFDCFRPLEVQEAMWKLVPDSRYVANPRAGSNHNRGAAVDCALADEDGNLLPFPTPFDSFEPKAGYAYSCPKENPAPCGNRALLLGMMQSVGLLPLASEWWHFQDPKASSYPLLRLKPDFK